MECSVNVDERSLHCWALADAVGTNGPSLACIFCFVRYVHCYYLCCLCTFSVSLHLGVYTGSAVVQLLFRDDVCVTRMLKVILRSWESRNLMYSTSH